MRLERSQSSRQSKYKSYSLIITCPIHILSSRNPFLYCCIKILPKPSISIFSIPLLQPFFYFEFRVKETQNLQLHFLWDLLHWMHSFILWTNCQNNCSFPPPNPSTHILHLQLPISFLALVSINGQSGFSESHHFIDLMEVAHPTFLFLP